MYINIKHYKVHKTKTVSKLNNDQEYLKALKLQEKTAEEVKPKMGEKVVTDQDNYTKEGGLKES